MSNLLFKNVKIIKEKEILSGYNLLVEDGKIARIFAEGSDEKFDQIISARFSNTQK